MRRKGEDYVLVFRGDENLGRKDGEEMKRGGIITSVQRRNKFLCSYTYVLSTALPQYGLHARIYIKRVSHSKFSRVSHIKFSMSFFVVLRVCVTQR